MLNPIFIRLARAFPMVALALCGALVSACGGGGGGGSGGGGTRIVGDYPVPPIPSVPDNARPATFAVTVADPGQSPDQAAAAIRNTGEFGRTGSPLDRINAEYAHARGFSGQGVTVAVIDHGLDLDHPEFAGRVTNGFDIFNPGKAPQDDDGHGTDAAGIIAAAKNERDIHGVAYDATVVPVRYLSASGETFNIFDFQNGFRIALGNAFVVNNSWGGLTVTNTRLPDGRLVEAKRPESRVSPGERQVLQEATRFDSVLVFAAGNEGWNTETGRVAASVFINDDEGYTNPFRFTPTENISGALGLLPNDHPELVGHYLHVVALESNNRIARFSNGCGGAKDWCLAAPGVNIRTTQKDGRTNSFTGTSAAAPFVSGAAAVLKSAFPNLGAKQVVALLLMTARDLGDPGVDEVYGHGVVDLEKATRPQTDPACGDGYQCPRNAGGSGLRLAAAQSGGDGMQLSDFRLSPTEESRIAPSPVFGDAFNRTRAQVGFVDAFDRAYQTDLSRFAASPPSVKSDAAKAARMESETTTRKLANGFFIKADGDGSPRMFGWRGRSDGRDAESESGNGGGNGLSAALLESRRDVVDGGGGSGREFDLAFALGAERWRGMEVGAGGFAAGMRAAEFSQTGAGMRQWFVSRKFSGNGSVLKNASDRNGGGAGGSGVGGSGVGGSGVGGSGGWVLESELGMLDESETTLGASFSGAFANGGARTFYGRVSASADLGFGGNGNLGSGLFGRDAEAFAGLLAMRTDAGGDFSELRSRGWELGLSGDDWRLRLMSPLRIRSGALRWRGVGGYDDAGHYRATESQTNLSSSDSRRLTFTTKAMGAWWSAESTATGATRFSLSASRTF